MDPVSQGVLGAGWAQSAADRQRLVPAAIVGCVAGMAPDIDVFISSSTDPLLFLEYHRHFTHSLAFIPIGALVCALLLFRLIPGSLTFKQTYVFAFLGFASHGLLDACTTYGTLLFWPFSDARIAWNNVSVVDPLFTVPIGVLIVLALKRSSPRYAHVALLWAVAYLAFGLYQTDRATNTATALAASRGHTPTRIQTMPAFGTLALWKSLYEFDGRYYVDAIRTGLTVGIFEGGSAQKLDTSIHFPWLNAGSQQALDIERFRHFTSDFLAIDTEAPNTVVDMRYSMLPNEIDALWGIELIPTAGDANHVRFFTDRSVAAGRSRRLLNMLLGACTEPPCLHLTSVRAPP